MEWDFSFPESLNLLKEAQDLLLLLDNFADSKVLFVIKQSDKIETRGQIFHVDLLGGVGFCPSQRFDSAAGGIVNVSIGEVGEFVVHFYIDHVVCRVGVSDDVEARQ